MEHGVDGIAVSNHGARQLDRVDAPIDILEPIVAAVDGRAEIWVDGGVRRGLDIPIALALGARAALVGRPLYWALATAGEQGVAYALELLRQELVAAMMLLGTPGPHDVTRAHVRQAGTGPSSVSLME
jgi:isopentenyl diphosphate isomerase/L-lactate dehydrogenase-like FMN-dependent dehydrogenase